MELDETNLLFSMVLSHVVNTLRNFFSSVQLWAATDQQREAVIVWLTHKWMKNCKSSSLSPFFSLLFSIHHQIICDWKSNTVPDWHTLDSEYLYTPSFGEKCERTDTQYFRVEVTFGGVF